MCGRSLSVAAERHALLESVDMAEIPAVVEYARTMSGSGEYACRIREIAARRTVSARNLAILGSAVGGYLRDAAKARAVEHVRDSQWIGAEGDKLSLPITIIDVVALPDNGYGSADIVKLATESGDVLTWTTKASHPAIGWAGTLTCAVKRHSEYRGVKETAVLRCKFTPAT